MKQAVGRHLLALSLIVLLAISGLLYLALRTTPATTHNAKLVVFGTVVELQVVGLEPTAADALIATIQHDFQRLHRDWHSWEPGQLEDLNRAIAEGQSAPIDPDLRALLVAATKYEQQSLGHFNPAIGNLIRLWGFHTSDYPVLGPPPADSAIEQWLNKTPSLTALTINPTTISSTNPAVRIDLGGIAKGAAIDRAIAQAREAGAPAALINAGGDLRGFGSGRNGDDRTPWRIAIRNPSDDQVLGGIEIRDDEAIFTSGNYTRFRRDQNRRFSHIIDPHRGWPVDYIASATVIANNGMLADAAATALVVAGPDHWQQVANRMGIELALLVDESGCILMTPTMHERVELLISSECPSQ